jgi:crotonobetainyl-CoA:carnitine CoA-transferase CaiB-like acyl-CoA transferase
VTIEKASSEDPALPLTGVRVVDLTMNIAGPYGAMILGDFGAEVIKIERPKVGDDARRMYPTHGGGSAYFYAVNRNKRSVALDLRDQADRALLDSLLAESDVLVTNWRPQKLAALGLDYKTLHAAYPRLVYGDISAYGNEGPEAERSGYDMVVQARSGLMSVNGEPGRPATRVGVSILDMGSGIWLGLGVLGALRLRDRTGEGHQVSTSLLEVGAAFMAYDVATAQLTGTVPGRRASGHPAFSPYGVFRCAEGTELAIGVGADHLFVRLADAVGAREWLDDARFATNEARARHAEALRSELEARLAVRLAEDWVAILSDYAIPVEVVADVRRVLADEQLASIDVWHDVQIEPVEGGRAGPVRLPGLPLRFDRGRPPIRFQPPGLGADTHEVAREMGGGAGGGRDRASVGSSTSPPSPS